MSLVKLSLDLISNPYRKIHQTETINHRERQTTFPLKQLIHQTELKQDF
jgi:hypothetical protein